MATGSTTDVPGDRSRLRLHWSPDSANLPVRILLELLDLPYEARRVDRARGAHRSAEHLALNPQGLLPVLEDGQLVLFETGAILLHLAERTGRYGPDGPDVADPAARAKVLRWLFFLSNTLHSELRVAFYAGRFVPAAGLADLRAGIARRTAGHLTLIETELGKGGLADRSPTLLEAYLACCARWAQLYPSEGPVALESLVPWPRVSGLLEDLEQHPAVSRAMQAEAIPTEKPFTRPRLPDLPMAAILGT